MKDTEAVQICSKPKSVLDIRAYWIRQPISTLQHQVVVEVR